MRAFQSVLICSFVSEIVSVILFNALQNHIIIGLLSAVLLALTTLCMIYQIVAEGWIYHLIPTYFSATLVLISIICVATQPSMISLIDILFAISLLLTLVSVVFILILPIPVLPLPKGPYHVGTTMVKLPEGDTLKLFYPTDAKHGIHAPYFLLTGNKIFEEELHYENRLFGHKILAHHVVFRTATHSLLNAPLSEKQDKIPVVLYSHGQQATVEENTHLCENLASFYYVVVALYHHDELPGQSPVTRRLNSIENALKFLTELNDSKEMKLDTLIPHEVQAIASKDLSLDFCGRLALEGVGIFGQSFGASTALLACSSSDLDPVPEWKPSIICGVGLDCWMYPLRINYMTVQKPFLFLSGDMFMRHQKHNFDELCKKIAEGNETYLCLFESTPHQNFTEFQISFGTAWNSNTVLSTKFFTGSDGGMDWGKTDGRLVLDVLGDLLVEYFKHHLKKSGSKFDEEVLKQLNQKNVFSVSQLNCNK